MKKMATKRRKKALHMEERPQLEGKSTLHEFISWMGRSSALYTFLPLVAHEQKW